MHQPKVMRKSIDYLLRSRPVLEVLQLVDDGLFQNPNLIEDERSFIK